MAQGKEIPIFMGLLILFSSLGAYQFHGGKVLVAIGIGAQIMGFTLMLLSRTGMHIKNEEKFKEIFERLGKYKSPEIEGSPILGRLAGGIWLILGGLSIQLTGLFLI